MAEPAYEQREYANRGEEAETKPENRIIYNADVKIPTIVRNGAGRLYIFPQL